MGCLIQTAIDFRLHAALTKRKITLNGPGIRGMSVKMIASVVAGSLTAAV